MLNGPRQGTELVLPPPPARLRVGRAETNDLWLDDGDCSREHAEIQVDLDGVSIRDLGSKNGLEHAGRKFQERRLKDRDEVVIGATVVVFEDPAERFLREREALAGLPLPPEPTEERPPVVEAVPTASKPVLPAIDPEPPSESRVSDPHAEPPPRPLAPAPPSWPKRRFTAEMLVLLIAGGVLAASALGLYYLLAS